MDAELNPVVGEVYDIVAANVNRKVNALNASRASRAVWLAMGPMG